MKTTAFAALLPLILLLSGCSVLFPNLRTENEMLQQRNLALSQDLATTQAQLQKAVAARDAAIAASSIAPAGSPGATTLDSHIETEQRLRSDIERLTAQINALEKERTDLQDQRRDLMAHLDSQAQKVAKAQEDLQAQAQLATSLTAERDAALNREHQAQEQIEALRKSAAAPTPTPPTTTPALETAQLSLERALVRELKNDQVDITRDGNAPVVIIYSDEFFQPGTTNLSTSAVQVMKNVEKGLNGFPWKRLIFSGHTDDVPVGKMVYVDNWELAAARACGVARWLSTRAGMDAAKFEVRSLAYYAPRGDNKTPAGRRKNRRVELKVVLPE